MADDTQRRLASQSALDLGAFSWNPRMNRRGFMALAATTGAAALLAGCGGAAAPTSAAPALGTKLEGQLHIYNWGSYTSIPTTPKHSRLSLASR